MPDLKHTLVEEGYGWKHEPDFRNPVYTSQAEFIYRASQALTAFNKQWKAEHGQHEDSFAHGLELDIIPVMVDGTVMGFFGISEIDGVSYDYFPDTPNRGKYKIIENEETNG